MASTVCDRLFFESLTPIFLIQNALYNFMTFLGGGASLETHLGLEKNRSLVGGCLAVKRARAGSPHHQHVCPCVRAVCVWVTLSLYLSVGWFALLLSFCFPSPCLLLFQMFVFFLVVSLFLPHMHTHNIHTQANAFSDTLVSLSVCLSFCLVRNVFPPPRSVGCSACLPAAQVTCFPVFYRFRFFLCAYVSCAHVF